MAACFVGKIDYIGKIQRPQLRRSDEQAEFCGDPAIAMKCYHWLLCAIFALTGSLEYPRYARAEDTRGRCLVEGAIDSQVSGKLAYVRFKHPSRDVVIEGYKLILQTPRCYEFTEPESNKTIQGSFTEIAVLHGDRFTQLLKDHIGEAIIVSGRIENQLTIYYVAVPQIEAKTIKICKELPNSAECP